MRCWDEQKEFINKCELDALQLNQLRMTLSRALEAPFYRSLFEKHGVTVESIKTLDHIKDLPFTSKKDLRAEHPEDFLSVGLEQVVRIHVTSGTTGDPIAVYHTKADINGWTDLVSRCLFMVGVRPTDVFQNMMGYGLFTGGLGLHYGAERLGAMVIPAGAGNSYRQISLMRRFGTTVVHIIPSYALKLLETFSEMKVNPKTDLNLRIAFIGAEPHSESTRQRIEQSYGVSAFNCYGLSEMNGPGVACECPYQNGLHVWEDNYLLEVIDPITLEPVPAGEKGEIVMTTLRREAMPLIRYRTRDLAMVLPDPCPCGRSHRRISRILGRADDMLILKGVNIFPMQVERVLMAHPDTGGNYLIVLERQGAVDSMTVRVEMSEELSSKGADEQNKVASGVCQILKNEILITPKVELVPPGALPSSEGKAARVVDKRPKELE